MKTQILTNMTKTDSEQQDIIK